MLSTQRGEKKEKESDREGPGTGTAPFSISIKKKRLNICVPHLYIGVFTGRRSCFVPDRFYGGEVRGTKKINKKTLATTVCFCQLRDAAEGSREQREEGGR